MKRIYIDELVIGSITMQRETVTDAPMDRRDVDEIDIKLEYVLCRKQEETQTVLQVDKIGERHFNVLRNRWNSYHCRMNYVLNRIVPDTCFVAIPWDKEIVLKMLTSTEWNIRIPEQDDIIYVEMEAGKCHDNVKQLYDECQIEEPHEGYALSKDGLWRNHSWGIDANGKIVETTEKRLCYVCC